MLESIGFPAVFWAICGVAVVHTVSKWIYNLFLHPLRHIPGPKLAAMTSLYECWFDLIKDGKYVWEMGKMHDKYGPIVRVNPREVHIRDSDYYGNIYTGSSRIVDKDGRTMAAFALPTSVTSTIDHYHHRARRSYISPYFSTRSIAAIEPVIHERIGKLCERLDAALESGQVVALDSAFAAMTADIITHRFYGEHLDYLDIPDYKMVVTEAFLSVTNNFHLIRFLPGLSPLLKQMPIPIMRMIMPCLADMLELQEYMKQKITNLLKEAEDLSEYEKKEESRSVIISAFIDPNIPPPEREMSRLIDEGVGILFAGTETSARAMSVAFFHLLENKSHIMRIREELRTLPFTPDSDYSMLQLESLPYLSGVVNEGLRLSFGSMGRIPRVAPHESLQYKNFTIPPGTPVSQSAYFVHTDPTIYPNPDSFDPTRWIKAAEEGFPLNKFLVSFSKGTRQCLGIRMALTEMYLTMARLANTFDMDLYNTTREDVTVHHVRLMGFPKIKENSTNARSEIMVKIAGRAKPVMAE